MRRSWKQAAAVRGEEGWGVELDGRPLRTPGRLALSVPSEGLAKAIADEWQLVGETIDPGTMPLTGLANAAVERIAPDTPAFAAGIAKYAETDLACYRAETPRALVERQAGSWDPLLGWARRRYDVDFVTTQGVVHVAQPRATVEALSHAVSALDPFRLAALSPLVTIGGSLVGALAVLEGAMSAEAVWDAVTIDEQWQLEQWGADEEAQIALANRRRDFLAAARFLALLDA